MCASAGGQWQCEAFGPMAFKGFTRGVCDDDEDGDEDGDDDMVCEYDYTHSYGGNSCRGPSACGCGEDSFCNFVDGDSGGCEACSDFDSVSECYYGNDMPKDGKVVVEGVNVAARHRKPTQQNPQGGIDRFEAPMSISKVALADPKDGKPTRVRFEEKDGKKVRVAVKSGETIDG